MSTTTTAAETHSSATKSAQKDKCVGIILVSTRHDLDAVKHALKERFPAQTAKVDMDQRGAMHSRICIDSALPDELSAARHNILDIVMLNSQGALAVNDAILSSGTEWCTTPVLHCGGAASTSVPLGSVRYITAAHDVSDRIVLVYEKNYDVAALSDNAIVAAEKAHLHTAIGGVLSYAPTAVANSTISLVCKSSKAMALLSHRSVAASYSSPVVLDEECATFYEACARRGIRQYAALRGVWNRGDCNKDSDEAAWRTQTMRRAAACAIDVCIEIAGGVPLAKNAYTAPSAAPTVASSVAVPHAAQNAPSAPSAPAAAPDVVADLRSELGALKRRLEAIEDGLDRLKRAHVAPGAG